MKHPNGGVLTAEGRTRRSERTGATSLPARWHRPEPTPPHLAPTRSYHRTPRPGRPYLRIRTAVAIRFWPFSLCSCGRFITGMLSSDPLRSALICRDSGALKAMRKDGQAHSSTSAISGLPRSPVLATPPGSDGRIAVSAPVRGQCSTPRGATKSSRVPSATSRSRIWMVTCPPTTGKNSPVIEVPVPAELALELHDPGIITNLLRSLRSATIELTVQNRTLPYGLGATLES